MDRAFDCVNKTKFVIYSVYITISQNDSQIHLPEYFTHILFYRKDCATWNVVLLLIDFIPFFKSFESPYLAVGHSFVGRIY